MQPPYHPSAPPSLIKHLTALFSFLPDMQPKCFHDYKLITILEILKKIESKEKSLLGIREGLQV